MGQHASEPKTLDEVRSRLAVRLNFARPSHVWTPSEPKVQRNGSLKPGCQRCPVGSPFQKDLASHPYIIEEEPCP